MDPLRVVVAWGGRAADQQAVLATAANDVERVRRLSQLALRAAAVWSGWALAHGGSVVESGGTTGMVELPAAALAELAQTRENAASALEGHCAVGIGKGVDQASKALKAAANQTLDAVVFYSPSLETSLAKADEGSGGTQRLGSVPHKAAASRQHGEHSEGEVAEKAAEVPHPAPVPGADYEQHFRAAASRQAVADRAGAARKDGDMLQLKQQVATALEGLRTQLPVLQQIKSGYPDTYKSILTLVQSVVALGRELESADQTLQKKERSTKVWRVGDDWGDKLAIPSQQHASRPEWDKAIVSNIAAHYAKGNAAALKFADLPVHQIQGGNTSGVVNQGRYRMYRRMYTVGDLPHPVVVTPSAGGYKLLDGTHRHAAAKDAGLATVPAVIVPGPMRKAIGSIAPGRKMDNYPSTASDRDGAALQNDTYDYSHLLDPNLHKGLQLRVTQSTDGQGRPRSITASLNDGYHSVGDVKAHVFHNADGEGKHAIEPHSFLEEEYRGKGLGQKLYEAVYAHAANVAGIRKVEGGIHSEMVHKTHQRLAAKHGFAYNAQKRPPHQDGTPRNFAYGDYSYTLKTAPEASTPDEELLGPGKGISFWREELDPAGAPPPEKVLDKGAPDPTKPHRHLVLPVGTTNHGEMKVKHADGKTSWKGVRAGLIQGQEPGVPQMGANSHPVSSREPGSR